MPDRVLVEFTSDTEVRKKGDRLWVDLVSAKSFMKKKVANLVDDKPELVKPEPTPPPLGGVA